MNKARLEQLLAFLEEDPNDPFHWYAIGNEYRREEPEKALHYWRELQHRFPEYLPTYFALAELLVEEEENELAAGPIDEAKVLVKHLVVPARRKA